jgi:uncharacterized membrane protein SpoIIM required for sporulation
VDAKVFVEERHRCWQQLEQLLERASTRGFRTLQHREARQLAALYRQTSSDLIEARSQVGSYEIEQYLNDLVARAYGQLYHRGREPVLWPIVSFIAAGFPRALRRSWPYLACSAGVFLLGFSFSFVAVHLDPDAGDFFIPEMFDQGSHFQDPAQRVREAETQAEVMAPQEQAAFSSLLFYNNAAVGFLAFGLGIGFGVMTCVLLFYNGVIMGAFAAQYLQAGQGLFFAAWILPHGIPELFAIIVAGAAGLLLGRGVLAPGRRGRGESLRVHGREAVLLVLGTIPLLLVAGIIEGTISQIHEPVLPYELKLTFAGCLGLLLCSYVLLAGRMRGASTRRREARAPVLRQDQSAS